MTVTTVRKNLSDVHNHMRDLLRPTIHFQQINEALPYHLKQILGASQPVWEKAPPDASQPLGIEGSASKASRFFTEFLTLTKPQDHADDPLPEAHLTRKLLRFLTIAGVTIHCYLEPRPTPDNKFRPIIIGAGAKRIHFFQSNREWPSDVQHSLSDYLSGKGTPADRFLVKWRLNDALLAVARAIWLSVLSTAHHDRWKELGSFADYAQAEDHFARFYARNLMIADDAPLTFGDFGTNEQQRPMRAFFFAPAGVAEKLSPWSDEREPV